MSNIRSLFDSNDDDQQQHPNDPNATSSFTGGEKSGLAVFNPPEPGQQKPDNRFMVTVYRNGFQVNGGPFRDTSIPENAQALQDMRQGIAPPEIQQAVVASGQNMREVQVMVNQKDEDYSGPTQAEANSGEADNGSGTKVETHTGATVHLDESKPMGTIQFRFPDGQRKVQKFNLDSHKVSDVVAFAASCIGADPAALTLVSGFPPKPLADLSLSVRDAGLDGAAVTVKLN
ncbi:NSFL1 cofactor p47 [Perkinsus olseni]|uniref:NSFL1 cofactor p47 n=1 Tax=Perkinsus olseni TaxID=32597 RepID=A0A7J6L2L3_PEROL|nr:NSFL1 cofactor p47 [Perkinsus olseni]KAF4653099.1 NSFL1 cofactor p47 [Perkinsus olseni]